MTVPMSKFSRVLQYGNMLLWLMLNGSVVMLLQGNYLIPVVLAFFAIQFLIRRKQHIYLNNIVLLLTFLAIYLINYWIYAEQCWNSNQYFVNMLLFLCAALFAQLFTLEDFKKTYVNTMVAVAVFSLVMHFGAVFFGIDQFATRTDNIMPLGLHNYWGFSVGRNSGMFWEPGGFQIFLNLALLFSVYEKSNGKTRHLWAKRIILIGTVLTTQSTVGYLALAFICAVFMWKKLKAVRKKQFIVLAWIGYLAALIILYVALMNSEAVQNKLFTDNASTTMRWGDFVGSMELLKKVPFYGAGVNTYFKNQLLSSKNIVNNSVGFLASSINYGIFYMLLYACIVFFRVRTFMSKGRITLLIVLVLVSLTQSVFEFPVMFLFLFRFKGETITTGVNLENARLKARLYG